MRHQGWKAPLPAAAGCPNMKARRLRLDDVAVTRGPEGPASRNFRLASQPVSCHRHVRSATLWPCLKRLHASASSAPARWATASPRCSRNRVSTSRWSTPPRRARARARDDRQEPREARREGQARRPATAPPPSAGITTAPRSTRSRDADFIVEAIYEDARGQTSALRVLDAIASPDVILASNTSSISITTLGAATNAAGQGAGHALHEPGAADDARRADSRSGDVGRVDGDGVSACASGWARPPVEAADYPGFIANRVLMPMINEAIFA